MRARYYSPELRRFVNSDILMGDINNSATLNRYAYANGNPISNIDPFGMAADESRGGQSTTNDWFDKAQKLFTDAFDWSVDTFKYLTAEGYLDWFLELSLGATPTDDIYHIRQDWWQSILFVGYNDLYDLAFDFGVGLTGTTMDRDKFKFTANDKDYVIWVWKGDYINLGSGAEAGIYEESIIPGHWLTSTDNNLKMSLSLKELDSGDVLFDYHPTENNWWITGFDPSHQNAQASNLQSTVSIDFSNNTDLYIGFYNAYGPRNSLSKWTFEGKVATLIW